MPTIGHLPSDPRDHSQGSDVAVVPPGSPEELTLRQGDPRDDDATILDEFFIEVDNAPKPVATEFVEQSDVRPSVPSQTISDTFTISGNTDASIGQAFQLFVADIHRKSVRIKVTSSTATDYIRIADENTKVNQDRGSYRISANETWQPLDTHTGPLWYFVPSTITGPIVVSWQVITEGVK